MSRTSKTPPDAPAAARQVAVHRRMREQALKVPWRDIATAVDRLIEHECFALWVRTIADAERAVPEWLLASIDHRYPGFGSSRRLVLYDTIIAQEHGDLLLNTIGHELGHNVLGHIPRGLLFAALSALPGAWILAWGFRRVLTVHGAVLQIGGVADPAGLPLLLLLLSLLSFFSEPIANAYSRMQEHDADRFSLDVTRGIIADPGQAAAQAFQLEGQANLDVPDPDKFIVFWLYSHPPTADRVKFSLEYKWR